MTALEACVQSGTAVRAMLLGQSTVNQVANATVDGVTAQAQMVLSGLEALREPNLNLVATASQVLDSAAALEERLQAIGTQAAAEFNAQMGNGLPPCAVTREARIWRRCFTGSRRPIRLLSPNAVVPCLVGPVDG